MCAIVPFDSVQIATLRAHARGGPRGLHAGVARRRSRSRRSRCIVLCNDNYFPMQNRVKIARENIVRRPRVRSFPRAARARR